MEIFIFAPADSHETPLSPAAKKRRHLQDSMPSQRPTEQYGNGPTNNDWAVER